MDHVVHYADVVRWFFKLTAFVQALENFYCATIYNIRCLCQSYFTINAAGWLVTLPDPLIAVTV